MTPDRVLPYEAGNLQLEELGFLLDWIRDRPKIDLFVLQESHLSLQFYLDWYHEQYEKRLDGILMSDFWFDEYEEYDGEEPNQRTA